jgi:copper transport protein
MRRVARWVLAPVLLAAAIGVGVAPPASAHAALVQSTPANGATLAEAPAEVSLRFTEEVDLVDDGIRLLDGQGATVRTPSPVARGHTVTWPMPQGLGRGSYLVTWRVVSADGHPIAGAFSFGVGAVPTSVPDKDTGIVTEDVAPATTAPWQVLSSRLAGYLAFAALAGVVAFVLGCSPGAAASRRLRRLVRGGLVVGLLAALTELLLEGPYTAGVSMTRVVDVDLLRRTLGTEFGRAMLVRLALYVVLAVLVWRLPAVTAGLRRWVAPVSVVALAVAIADAGHGAVGGPFELAVLSLHALTAGIWVGGLFVLVALGRSIERRAVERFSRLALVCVLALAGTGVLNSLQEVPSAVDLFLTRYGLLLLAKLALVAAALGAAAVSRHRVRQDRVPLLSVRSEAGLTAVVLALTATLSMTSPPADRSAALAASASPGRPLPSGQRNGLVQLRLQDGRTALLAVLPANTAGSVLRLAVADGGGTPPAFTHLGLTLSNPGRDVGAIPVVLTLQSGVWSGRFRFPLPGTWKATLTVEDRDHPSAWVTAGTVDVDG